jgi:hypothetical protein
LPSLRKARASACKPAGFRSTLATAHSRALPKPSSGQVARSNSSSRANASSLLWPHISGLGRNRTQTAGRSGWPNSRQRLSSVNCTHRTPAGLPWGMPGMGEEIERTTQQAAQPALHSISATQSTLNSSLKSLGERCRCRHPGSRQPSAAVLSCRDHRPAQHLTCQSPYHSPAYTTRWGSSSLVVTNHRSSTSWRRCRRSWATHDANRSAAVISPHGA